MKLSYAYLIVLISVLSSTFVAAEDVSDKNAEVSDSKFFGLGGLGGWGYWGGGRFAGLGGYSWLNPWMGNAYGFGLYRGLYGGWLKSADGHQERRSIQELHNLMSRADHTVSCKNMNGEVAHFETKSCLSAANKLANQHASSATCGACSLSIQGPNGALSAKSIPSSELTKATLNILKACAKGESKMLAASELERRSPLPEEIPSQSSSSNDKSTKDAFAVVLLKGNGPACA
ncbi:hypothetical protein BY996DRAFT_6415754 [Phakopsora pachyrhizi]|uniref:Expressed protein n=1 Tax=Phakopsora pachyrhizi TaxID=170000 RepID=A0AAV0ARX6_PHAPC|nr:hypothetical protein BY996DRAFT_6415754 [Phakopsora pachyrhizi]CAH7671203.1 expressed protein [Phakopsora pachyrhizi]